MTKPDLTRARAMANLYRSGATLREIATHFEVSFNRVRQILQDYTGIEMRPRGQRRATAIEACGIV